MSDPAYFLYHSIGQYPGKTREMAAALAEFSGIWGTLDDAQWPRVLEARAEYLALWRDLIKAPDGTLTSTENVTTGLFSVLGGLPPDRIKGKRVLVAADCFPSLHFLLAGLAERLGFRLDTVPVRPGEFWVRDDDLIAAWGSDVGLALLTFVTSTASHRCNLSQLITHGQAQGSLVGVDLTQGAGIVPFSLTETPADFVLSTTLKWLCGPPGAGIVQMRRELMREVKPELRGWFSQENPFAWDLDAFEYAQDARRFDHGTPSALACIGAVPALKWHAAQTGLAEQNRALAAQIIEEAQMAGLQIASPLVASARGGSMMLKLPEGVSPDSVVTGLRSRDVFVDARGRILRLSPGAVTKPHHVEHLFASLRALI